MQAMLNAVGASPALAIDGAFGPKSEQALLEFQTSKNLPPTGELDPATLKALTTAFHLESLKKALDELIPESAPVYDDKTPKGPRGDRTPDPVAVQVTTNGAPNTRLTDVLPSSDP